MAQYGTKEYYEEKVVQAETKVDLVRFALINRIKGAESEPTVEQLRTACKVFLEVCDEVGDAKERYDVCCSNESGS